MPRLLLAATVTVLGASSCAVARSSLGFDDDFERIEGAMAFEAFSPTLPGAGGIFLASDAAPLCTEVATSPTPTEVRQSPWVLTNGARRWYLAPHPAFVRTSASDPRQLPR